VEFRSNERKPLALHVVISYPGLGLVCGRTRDVSLGGMFVETGQIILSRNQQVGLCFHVPVSGEDVLCVADARVAHTGMNGVGLSFRHTEKRTQSALREVMGWPTAGVSRHPKQSARKSQPPSADAPESWDAMGGAR